MAIVSIHNLHIRFRGPALLDGVSCRIEPEQRIGLLGRNGAGKTTLLRMLAGNVEPDDGEIIFAPRTRVSLLPQGIPREIDGSITDVVAQGLSAEGENTSSWKAQHKIDQILSRMQLDAEAVFAHLSSGMKRRVLLARALVAQPDLLLLDEPTNHLDLDAIQWLEEFLSRWRGTLLFVTHDRQFLRRLATRILEIDRGRLFDWSCDYETFLQRKDAAIQAEEKQNALFDKKLAQEEAWVRQGIKARRTRNEGRVRALQELRRIRQERQARTGNARIVIQEAQRSGRLVAEVDNISFAYEESTPIVRDFSCVIMRGDTIGIVGPNGAGKTTLLRILLGQLSPQQGRVRLGTNLQIAYFDQLREQLQEDRTVIDNVTDGSQTINLGGGSKHVIGYLQDFLFTPERARTPVRFLSGGERNRILLAKLFAKPANVIVLDEPTNDLDTETLELLEQRLVSFDGTVLLVSHDRAFLNNVVTSTLVFEEHGVKEYVGGYDDWLRQRPPEPISQSQPATNPKPPPESKSSIPAPARLKFKEQQELAALPERIEKLETEIADTHQRMAQPDFYKQSGDAIALEQTELKKLETQLAAAYARWEELELRGG